MTASITLSSIHLVCSKTMELRESVTNGRKLIGDLRISAVRLSTSVCEHFCNPRWGIIYPVDCGSPTPRASYPSTSPRYDVRLQCKLAPNSPQCCGFSRQVRDGVCYLSYRMSYFIDHYVVAGALSIVQLR